MVQHPVENVQVSSVQNYVANDGFATQIYYNTIRNYHRTAEQEPYYPLAKRQLGRHKCVALLKGQVAKANKTKQLETTSKMYNRKNRIKKQ